MTRASTRPSAPPTGVPLALARHLDAEEAAVRDLLKTLRDIRQALLKHDLDGFTAALERQAKAAQAAESLRANRDKLFPELARVMGIAAGQGVTLRQIAERLPEGAAAWVQRRREQLREMALDMDRLNRQNAAMVQQSIELTRQVMGALTRQSPGGTGYDAYGSRQEAVGKSIFDLGG